MFILQKSDVKKIQPDLMDAFVKTLAGQLSQNLDVRKKLIKAIAARRLEGLKRPEYFRGLQIFDENGDSRPTNEIDWQMLMRNQNDNVTAICALRKFEIIEILPISEKKSRFRTHWSFQRKKRSNRTTAAIISAFLKCFVHRFATIKTQ